MGTSIDFFGIFPPRVRPDFTPTYSERLGSGNQFALVPLGPASVATDSS
jgi:hypothetical protein